MRRVRGAESGRAKVLNRVCPDDRPGTTHEAATYRCSSRRDGSRRLVEHAGHARVATERWQSSAAYPRTHRFARARVVFAVARARCDELFDPPGSVTLWKLPADIEDQFDEHWHDWLAASDYWAPVFDALAASEGADLPTELRTRELISAEEVDDGRAMRRSAESRAVQSP